MRFLAVLVVSLALGGGMAQAATPKQLDMIASLFAGRPISVRMDTRQGASSGYADQGGTLFLSPDTYRSLRRMPKANYMSPYNAFVFAHELGHMIRPPADSSHLTFRDEAVADAWARNHIYNVLRKLGISPYLSKGMAKKAREQWRQTR